MSLLDNFPHECTIERFTRVADTKGGSREVPVVVSTGVECWEQDASSSEQEKFAKRGITDVKEVFFVTDPGVEEKNQITITKKDGVTLTSPIGYEVISASKPDVSAGLGILFSSMVKEISGRNQ